MLFLENSPYSLAGFLPEMSLHVDGPSRKIGQELKSKTEVVWEKEISVTEARRILQKKFYPFQEVRVLQGTPK